MHKGQESKRSIKRRQCDGMRMRMDVKAKSSTFRVVRVTEQHEKRVRFVGQYTKRKLDTHAEVFFLEHRN